MAESTRRLVLGFIGEGVVHRENAKALLEDLISFHRRDNRAAPVSFIFAIDKPTTTIDEMIDYCLTSGYTLGLVGHDTVLDHPKVRPYLTDASGNLFRISSERRLGPSLISVLTRWNPDARLILLGNPDEDDTVYEALTAAVGMSIKARSLLLGLEEVTLEAIEEEETQDMPVNPSDFDDDDDDFEPGASDVADIDEDFLDGEEPTAVVEGDDDDDVEPTLDEIPEPDLEPEPDEDDGEEASEEQPAEDLGDGDQPPDEEPGGTGEEEEGMAARTATKTKTKTEGWTEARLSRLFAKDRDAFWELAAEHKVYPGRGIKSTVAISRILESQNGSAPKTKTATTAKRTAKKHTAAKKAAPARPKATAAKPAATTTAPKMSSTEAQRLIDAAQTSIKFAGEVVKIARKYL